MNIPKLDKVVEPTVGELVTVAMREGKAFPFLFFPTPDERPQKFVAIDVKKHIEPLDCKECGESPRVKYSVDGKGFTPDGLQWVVLACEKCNKAVTLYVGSPLFSRARGTLNSVASCWWNSAQDPDGHPDDLHKNGGLLVEWDKLNAVLAAQRPKGKEE